MDFNSLAFRLVQEATGSAHQPAPGPAKDPAAVALGRRGGLKGGPARAAKLSPAKRRAIAKRAASARWGKK